MTSTDTERRLFGAFLAGFEGSGEGFNGEYVSDRYVRTSRYGPAERYNDRFYARMREAFDDWLADEVR